MCRHVSHEAHNLGDQWINRRTWLQEACGSSWVGSAGKAEVRPLQWPGIPPNIFPAPKYMVLWGHTMLSEQEMAAYLYGDLSLGFVFVFQVALTLLCGQG